MPLEETTTRTSFKVERLVRGEGRFVVVRFRNRGDLNNFADLLDAPQLKQIKKHTIEKLTWSCDKSVTDPFSSFME